MKSSPSNVWILVPAYNEEADLPSVLTDLQRAGWRNILVVDDGSQDQTATITVHHQARLLRLAKNRGQGAALRAGIDYLARHEQPDIIVTFDADGQHFARDIASVITPVADGSVDIVLGSRFLHSGNRVPWQRFLILKTGVIFTNLISRVTLTDTHNGLRALNRRAYTIINITHDGMAHASDIIDQVSRHNLRYQEVPVQVVYMSHRRGREQPVWKSFTLAVQILKAKLKDVFAR